MKANRCRSEYNMATESQWMRWSVTRWQTSRFLVCAKNPSHISWIPHQYRRLRRAPVAGLSLHTTRRSISSKNIIILSKNVRRRRTGLDSKGSKVHHSNAHGWEVHHRDHSKARQSQQRRRHTKSAERCATTLQRHTKQDMVVQYMTSVGLQSSIVR